MELMLAVLWVCYMMLERRGDKKVSEWSVTSKSYSVVKAASSARPEAFQEMSRTGVVMRNGK